MKNIRRTTRRLVLKKAKSEPVPKGSPESNELEYIKQLLVGLGLFDDEFYKNSYPDIVEAGIDPFEHFFLHGYTENRQPNAIFDCGWYLAQHEDVRTAGIQPLLHYARIGEREGRRPSPLFDPAWYRERYQIPAGESPLAHYLKHRTEAFSPIPEFDADYYFRTYPDIAAASVDPFEHFLRFGYREGRNPSEDFDTRFYVQRYLKGKFDENPLVHYLQHAHLEGYYTKAPENEATIPAEIKRFTKAGPEFEEFHPLSENVRRRAKVLAYYLPQFHPIAENDRWWGRGFTEWSNIARGIPRFRNHYQPRIPRDLGFYSLTSDDTMRRQAEIARKAGIHGFVFYYYWFNRKRLLEAPVEAFLRNADIDMPFCLMWANENWTRRWDGMESEVLIAQDYRAEDNEALLADFARHFADPRYIRIKGRPLLMFYRPGLIPDAAKAIALWRRLFKKLHGEDPIFVMGQTFNDFDPRKFGLDGAIEFPPHKTTVSLPRINDQVQLLDDTFSGNVYNYDDVVAFSLTEPPAEFPLIRTAVPSWDNDARRQGTGLVIAGSSPAKYEAWLTELVGRAQKRPFFGEAFVCINAWNEWCEGAYLEPDVHYGSAYLNATARAVSGLTVDSQHQKLLLVGHDAFPSGAQHLLLNIGRVLKENFGFQVEFLLLGDGALEEEYRKVAPYSVTTNKNELADKILHYRQKGFRAAICNTTASGFVAAGLKAAGFRTTLLVHELPRILREKKLEKSAADGISSADTVVFPCPFVKEKVLAALQIKPQAKHLLRTQGMYKSIAYDDAAANGIRAKLGVRPDEYLVIGVGYADLRKGFDLFYQVWHLLQGKPQKVHFCWVGDLDPQIKDWMEHEIKLATSTGTFHLVGYQKDVEGYFSAADAFLLSSREDPFPTVALEAMSVEVPVFAFADTGGVPEFLAERSVGFVAPYCDVPAMAATIEQALGQEQILPIIEAAKAVVQGEFVFEAYVQDLVACTLPGLATVSVVVPNYNYAHTLPERLSSIFEQFHPINELIVLDDRSTDNSIDVIIDVAERAQRELSVYVNDVNSGSVFAQWSLGAELASREFLWIAEADDLADPMFLSSLLTIMQTDPEIVMAFSDSRAIDIDGQPLHDSYKPYYATIEAGALTTTQVYDGAEFVRRFLSQKNTILNVSSVVWRRAALREAMESCRGELDGFKMAGDWRLYLEILSRPGAKIAYVAEPLNVHRRHAQSVTHSLKAQRHVEEIERCLAFAARRYDLEERALEQQARYLREVSRQLLETNK